MLLYISAHYALIYEISRYGLRMSIDRRDRARQYEHRIASFVEAFSSKSFCRRSFSAKTALSRERIGPCHFLTPIFWGRDGPQGHHGSRPSMLLHMRQHGRLPMLIDIDEGRPKSPAPRVSGRYSSGLRRKEIRRNKRFDEMKKSTKRAVGEKVGSTER